MYELTHTLIDERKSKYVYCRLAIKGLYEWGIGYLSSDRMRAFETEAYNALRAKGFEIKRSGSSSVSDTLTKPGTKTSVYMHPMEFTGPVLPEDIDAIVSALYKCSAITEVNIEETSTMYDLTDMEYRDILLDNASCMAEHIVKNRPYINTINFIYATRLNRVSCPLVGGTGSNDIDYDVITTMFSLIDDMLKKNMPGYGIIDSIEEWASTTKKRIHTLDEKIKDATAKMSLNELRAFYNISDTTLDNKVMEMIDKYHLKTISDYENTAVRNGISA